MNDARSATRITLAVLMAVWAGMVIGVSFLATPAKFQASSLSMPVALEVGRYTFRLFTRIELCFLIAVIIIATIARPRRKTSLALALVTVQVFLQQYWLLPALDNHVSKIIAGGEILFSNSHWVYVGFDAAKVALLVAAAVVELANS